MEYGSPDARPGHELRVDGRVVLDDDVIDGEVEERDETGDADNGERLGAEDAEHHGSQGGREKRLVDAKELPRAAVHVESVGYRGEEAVCFSTNVRGGQT